MKFSTGAKDKKKLAILGGLVLVLVYFLFSSSSDERPQPRGAATRSRASATETVFGVPTVEPRAETRARPAVRPASREQFRLTYKDKNTDPSSIDPALHTELLAKVQGVTITGGARNLFQFGSAPMPKTPEPKIIPKIKQGVAAAAAANGASAATPAPKPPPPPIPLKFYGYSSHARAGAKRAFFLDGEDIIVAGEGETIKRRYKVVRIGINSVVVEDTQFQNQQTLPLVEEQAG